ncbi:hypothetical protein, conserved [Eimeria praecox]|uniref:Uncharacterized protein n=1 Tax=Eimeria praecox TaxID=51316 RepID=U6GY78_9EIME|nr:hypothetical protein, conserved [Eimeria praecox]
MLLLTSRLQVDDLSLLKDLETVAKETEATYKQESRGWRTWAAAALLGLSRSSEDIWTYQAEKLLLQQQQQQQQQQQKQKQQQKHRERSAAHRGLAHRHRKKPLSEGGPLLPSPVITPPHSAAAATETTISTTATAAATAAAAAADSLSSSPVALRYCLLRGPRGDAVCSIGASTANQRGPLGGPPLANKHWGPRSCLKGEDGYTGIETAAGEATAAAAAAEAAAAAAAAGEAAAAACANISNNSLALLGHSCPWPLSAASGGPPQGYSGGDRRRGPLQVLGSSPNTATGDRDRGHPTPQGPPIVGEEWKSCVGFRERRRKEGTSSSRRREALRRRQRLSLLDPPYDAHALLLHPFAAAAAAALPDTETARAAEVYEVALEFLSRAKATQTCPQCTRPQSKGDTSINNNPTPCPHHQRLHYTQVGEILSSLFSRDRGAIDGWDRLGRDDPNTRSHRIPKTVEIICGDYAWGSCV